MKKIEISLVLLKKLWQIFGLFCFTLIILLVWQVQVISQLNAIKETFKNVNEQIGKLSNQKNEIMAKEIYPNIIAKAFHDRFQFVASLPKSFKIEKGGEVIELPGVLDEDVKQLYSQYQGFLISIGIESFSMSVDLDTTNVLLKNPNYKEFINIRKLALEFSVSDLTQAEYVLSNLKNFPFHVRLLNYNVLANNKALIVKANAEIISRNMDKLQFVDEIPPVKAVAFTRSTMMIKDVFRVKPIKEEKIVEVLPPLPLVIDEPVKVKPEVKKKEEIQDEVKLLSVMKSNEKKIAFILQNGKKKTVAVGDKVGSETVLAIEKKLIILNKGKVSRTIQL